MKRIFTEVVLGLVALLCLAALATGAHACPSYPYTLTNGQTADANQVMANFNSVLNCVNANVANAPANTNITSITGLTTPLSVTQGGTGATTLSGAVSNLGGPFLLPANNLSDIISPTTAVLNLGGPFLLDANNLSDVASPTAALTHLGGAPLASPALTGVPTAPTAAVGTNTTQVATTAFVKAASALSYAVFTDQQPSGTASGESIGGTSWTQMALNTTVVNTITGASLATNQVTLPAGVYEYTATSAVYQATSSAGFTNVRLRNATASSTIGVSETCTTIEGQFSTHNAQCVVHGVFSLGVSTAVELDRYLSVSGTGGTAASNGEPEVYGRLTLEKIG